MGYGCGDVPEPVTGPGRSLQVRKGLSCCKQMCIQGWPHEDTIKPDYGKKEGAHAAG